MKTKLILPAIVATTIFANCGNAEKEREKFVADSMARAEKIADSLDEFVAVEGVPFGCSFREAMDGLEVFDSKHSYLGIMGFKYSNIAPAFYDKKFRQVQFVSQSYSWAELNNVVGEVFGIEDVLTRKYGPPKYRLRDTSIFPVREYYNETVFGWEKGDKLIDIMLNSTPDSFKFTLEYTSARITKEAVLSRTGSY